jgi:NAD(P)H-hydrate epimerase
MTIPVHTGDIPYLTTSQMIEVDRAMMEDFRIDLIRMMENAGRTLAHLARVRFLGGTVHVTRPDEKFTPVPAHQLDILRRMNIRLHPGEEVAGDDPLDLVIDGVIGYSLQGAPTGTAGKLIRWANAQNAPVLSLDAPSGVDTTTGTVFVPAVKATATMTLALPKEGLRAPGVKAHVGELYLADISVPPALYAGTTLELAVGHLFAQNEIIRLP